MKVRRVVCAGTFDYLHDGHENFLRQAKSLGDELIVIVARDETVRRIKGFYPSHAEELRRSSVEGTGIPDQVILGNLDIDIFQIIDTLKPDVIALGYDQRVSEEKIRERFPLTSVLRLDPYHPDRFKSSLFRQKQTED